jgi:uncharacterized repeat protein (TIGR03803 family)
MKRNSLTRSLPSLIARKEGKMTSFRLCKHILLFVSVVAALPAQTPTILVNFDGTNGSYPENIGSLVQGTDGLLYGVTQHGGFNDNGTIFSMTSLESGGVLTVLHEFCEQNSACPDGSRPVAGLIQASDGNFYGTTLFGGNSCSCGTVFKISATGQLTTLHAFSGPDGSQPFAPLLQASDGLLYGTTQQGGSNTACAGCGTVFRIGTSGSEFKVLYSFNESNGRYPQGGLVEVKGKLYGTTILGGSSGNCTDNCGTVYSVTTAGVLTTLHSFDGFDGYEPFGSLVLATNGRLYGTTFYGGGCYGDPSGLGLGCGTIFEITTAGQFSNKLNFDGDGYYPYGTLIQATDGNLYGTTSESITTLPAGCITGACGTIFRFTLAGSLTILDTFAGLPGGAVVFGGLIEGTDKNLYGTTYMGGSSNLGTVYALTVPGL